MFLYTGGFAKKFSLLFKLGVMHLQTFQLVKILVGTSVPWVAEGSHKPAIGIPHVNYSETNSLELYGYLYV